METRTEELINRLDCDVLDITDSDGDTFELCIAFSLAADHSMSEEAFDALAAEEQDKAEDARVLAAWAWIKADAAKRLVVDDRQLMIPGIEPPPPLTVPEAAPDELVDGVGALAIVWTVQVPRSTREDFDTVARIEALVAAVAAFRAMEAAPELARQAETAAELEAMRTAILTAEATTRTVLVRVDHAETLRRLPDLLGRPVWVRECETQTVKGRVYGVTPEEWGRLNELRGRKVARCTKLRVAKGATWRPAPIEDFRLERALRELA